MDTAAFLRNVLDRPDDDAPRLICADWLEESGDGARAVTTFRNGGAR